MLFYNTANDNMYLSLSQSHARLSAKMPIVYFFFSKLWKTWSIEVVCLIVNHIVYNSQVYEASCLYTVAGQGHTQSMSKHSTQSTYYRSDRPRMRLFIYIYNASLYDACTSNWIKMKYLHILSTPIRNVQLTWNLLSFWSCKFKMHYICGLLQLKRWRKGNYNFHSHSF